MNFYSELCVEKNIINNKILVIRYGTIGDTVFASAFYRELRKALPNATIDILVDKIAGEVMQDCPYINNTFFIDGKFSHLFHYINLFAKYDTVYFLKNDNFFTKTAFLARVKNRIGFDVKRNFHLTVKVPYDEQTHEIDCYLNLLKATNIDVNNDKTEVWINKNGEQKILSFLSGVQAKKVLIQAYSRFSQKNWIDENWAKVIEYLSNEKHMQVFFAGSSNDCYDNIYHLIKSDLELLPINTCGKFCIQESMALVKNMDMVIGIDSGLMHIAAALNIPSILLNGPTSLTKWKPRSENCIAMSKNFECSPCILQKKHKKQCHDTNPKCMESISVQEVIENIKKIENKR